MKEKILKKLPNKVVLKTEQLPDYVCENIEEFISDYLADKYGYCNNGYGYSVHIEINDIDWYIDED